MTRFRWTAALCLFITAFSLPALAGGERVVLGNTPQDLITAPTGSSANLFRAIETKAGFLVTYAQSKVSVAAFTLYTRRFGISGKAIGAAVKFDGPGLVGDGADLAPISADRSVAVWSGSDGKGSDLKIGEISNTTGKASRIKPLGKSDDHIHDVIRLSNGNLAIVTPQVSVLPNRYKISLKIVSPTFATVSNWKSIHGNGFPLDAWAYLDQNIVPMKSGGIVLFRDHGDGKYKGRIFSNAGGLGKLVTLNTTAMGTFAVTDIAYLEIKGALLSDGRVIACWQHLKTPGTDRYDVRCRLLSDKGQPIGSDFLASKSDSGLQTSPEVVALDKGRFSVTFVQTDSIMVGSVRYRTFSAQGLPLFDDKPLATFAAKDFTMLPMSQELVRQKDGSLVSVFGPSAFGTSIRAARLVDPTK